MGTPKKKRERAPRVEVQLGGFFSRSNCGCCWAFAGAEAASDRICIASKGKTMVPISAQETRDARSETRDVRLSFGVLMFGSVFVWSWYLFFCGFFRDARRKNTILRVQACLVLDYAVHMEPDISGQTIKVYTPRQFLSGTSPRCV